MNWQPRKMVWSALLALCSTPALAANISVAPLGDDPTHAIVFVQGTLMPGDGEAFRDRVSSLTKAIVSFDSDGGNVAAGIEIGKTIWLKFFMTAVPDGHRCASACALAWLGGKPRFMGNGSHIGFHAAYRMDGGTAATSGVGNALIGMYLNQIGLSERAVIYMTQAAPTEMTWLTLRDAERFGIDVGRAESFGIDVKRAASLSRSELKQEALKKTALQEPATQPNESKGPTTDRFGERFGSLPRIADADPIKLHFDAARAENERSLRCVLFRAPGCDLRSGFQSLLFGTSAP